MSEIIGKSYNPYAMPSGAGGLLSGFQMGRQIAKERGLASGFAKIQAGDDSGWKEAFDADPIATMNAWNAQEKLKQAKTNKEFNTTNEIKNYEYRQSLNPEEQNIFDSFRKIPQEKQTTYDTTFEREEAKKYAEDLDAVRSAEATYPQLEKTVDRLKELAPLATYRDVGKATDKVLKEVFNYTTPGAEARAELESIVNNAVLPLLKQTFGAAFTAEEGIRLTKTLANPDASGVEKIKELETFISHKKDDIATKKRKLELYSKNDEKQAEPKKEPKKSKYVIEEVIE